MRPALACVIAGILSAALLAGCAAPPPAFAPKSVIDAALADPARTADDHKADALRQPAATLAFAGVKPGMAVAELFPGGGYFTRPISDIVGPKGHVYMLETTRWKDAVPADQKVLADPGRSNLTLDASPFGEFKLPNEVIGKVDLFWITQNYHDLHIAEYGHVDIDAFNRHVFDVLKPGGVYFILDHQANPDQPDSAIAKLHRIERAQVVREVTAAGFRLAGEGDFLHRASDDHTRPIFDLKGETDQYALKFVKPG